MEEAPSNRNALASLIEDVILEILLHLPALSLVCCKCVCRSWNRLISDSLVLPKTVVDFFYDGDNGMRNFTSLTGERPDLTFLPFLKVNVAVSDCCNGLILCFCLGATTGYRYVVCNPVTQNFKILPRSIHYNGEARLGFDPTTSSQYHVIQHVEEHGECIGVEIYSSETASWSYKESEWGQGTNVTFSRSGSVFLNGCLHIIGYSDGYSHILAVDMEGKTWRKIPRPPGTLPAIHQAQGHLCVCTVGGQEMSQLSVWILEDYGTNEWTLKHTVSALNVFGNDDIEFGDMDYDEDYTAISVHLEWNLIFFVGEERTIIIAYDTDHTKVHVIPIAVIG